MNRIIRYFIGMLAIAIPMCANAQNDLQQQVNDLKGKVDRMPKISGFVQGMFQANLDNDGKLMDDKKTSTFRMRRVRVSIDGNLSKTVSYKIQGDFVRSPMLVDAYVKYKPCKEFAIQLGQFKTPFTLESPINPVNLEIFDYGESVQKLVGYEDVCGLKSIGRDIGVMASGDLFQLEGNDYALINYSIGMFNGTGINTTDNNNRKDIVGRLEVHPGLKALTLSGSYYYGLYKGSSDLTVLEEGRINFGHGIRNRWTAGAQYNDGELVLRGEYISGETGYQLGLVEQPSFQECFLNSNGYYAVAGYNFKLGKENAQTLMPVLRYEHFTNDFAITKNSTNWYTIGINYWPLKSVNCKLDYSLIQDVNDLGKKTNSHRIVAILNYKF